MREILSGIFIWSRLSEPHGYNFNGYFIPHADGNLVIGPVEPEPEDLEHLMSEGVARLLITNRNHCRAANKVREATGARTAIHPLDAVYVPIGLGSGICGTIAAREALGCKAEVIGVVTSPTGAVIKDILHRLADRFPRHVLLAPVLVQGAALRPLTCRSAAYR